MPAICVKHNVSLKKLTMDKRALFLSQIKMTNAGLSFRSIHSLDEEKFEDNDIDENDPDFFSGDVEILRKFSQRQALSSLSLTRAPSLVRVPCPLCFVCCVGARVDRQRLCTTPFNKRTVSC